MAYLSDESGEFQVMVREFPEGEGRWQVSANGGVQPRWSRDGTELFYIEDNTLTAVQVSLSPNFVVGEAQPLFDAPLLGRSTWDYDVSADGRFVIVDFVQPEEMLTHTPSIHIIENWYEEFRDRE